MRSHRWPLPEHHLCEGFLQHLLILIAVVVQGILSDFAPDQTLILRVVQINDQCSDNILLRRDVVHAATNPVHAPRAVDAMKTRGGNFPGKAL